jgi:hypothetical protein
MGPENIKELYWAAGFWEGEGTCCCVGKKHNASSLQITAKQVNPEPLYRLQRVLGGKVTGPYKRPASYRNCQPIYEWIATGVYAAGVMMTLYSLLSMRRRNQLLIALSRWRAAPTANKYKSRCINGHELTKGVKRRRCLTCEKASMERYKQRHLKAVG